MTWEDRKYFGLKCSSLIRIFPWKQPRWILVMNVLIILTPLYISPETNSHVMCMLICLFWHVFAAIWRYLPSVYVAPMAKWFQSQFVKYFLFDYFVISMSMPTTVSFAAHGCEGGGHASINWFYSSQLVVIVLFCIIYRWNRQFLCGAALKCQSAEMHTSKFYMSIFWIC